MGRLLQAAVLVAGMVGVANAGPTRKVKVTSTPAGAKVYVGSVENDPACESTPCTFDVPLGDVNLIIRLDNYEVEFYGLENVKRGAKPLQVVVPLKAAVGTLRIVDAPKGAVVKVEGVDKGTVGKGAFEIEVPAGPATVMITYKGKTQTEMVVVEGSEPAEIQFTGGSAPATSVGDTGDDEGDGDGDEDGDGDGSGEGERIDDPSELPEEPTTPAPRAPYLQVGAAMDVGFRRFTYSDNTAPFTNNSEVVIGPALEVWLGRLLGVHAIRGLSLFARFEFGVNHQQVTKEVMGVVTDVGAATFSGAIEVSLRHKWQFGVVGVEASGGYVRDQLEFSAGNRTVLDMVPSADYKSIRIGARVSYVASFEPYIGGENRIVLDGGEIGQRGNGKASGYAFNLGVRTKLGPLGARAEFAYNKYSWQFANTSGPSGADDTVMWVGAIVGYAY